MSGSTDSFLAEGTRILREIAGQQGAAYRAYGETLQRYADSQIDLTGLLKSSGDLYIKEAARTAWSLVHASASMYSWILSLAGTKVLRPEAVAQPGEEKVSKPAQRGRR